MEHPPKQGLKHSRLVAKFFVCRCFNGTSTKTRIETAKGDWKAVDELCFNGTSTKTRIETLFVSIFAVCLASFNGTSTKTRIETQNKQITTEEKERVLMEHPPKQGLKHSFAKILCNFKAVLMEHPPKQGLKQEVELGGGWQPHPGFNGTSTKTRIETMFGNCYSLSSIVF